MLSSAIFHSSDSTNSPGDLGTVLTSNKCGKKCTEYLNSFNILLSLGNIALLSRRLAFFLAFILLPLLNFSYHCCIISSFHVYLLFGFPYSISAFFSSTSILLPGTFFKIFLHFFSVGSFLFIHNGFLPHFLTSWRLFFCTY